MIGVGLLVTFLAVVLTGPAGVEWRDRRAAARSASRDRPLARVIYLPASACRDVLVHEASHHEAEE